MSVATETVDAIRDAERAARRRLRKARAHVDERLARAQRDAKVTVEEAERRATAAGAERRARVLDEARDAMRTATEQLRRQLDEERERDLAARQTLVARMVALVTGAGEGEPCSSR